MASLAEELRRMRWSLQGMTALVTGGTRGIGRSIVEDLTRFGASVHTCCRNETDLNQALIEWSKSGLQVTGSVCDVSVQLQREKLMEEVSSLFKGKLNILVNNVGVNIGKPTVEQTAEDFSVAMTTNFESAYNFCQLAYPLLKNSGQGSIIFISSVTAALNQTTKYLACEWAKDNIRVNCIAPGITRTSMLGKWVKDDFQPSSSADERMTISLVDKVLENNKTFADVLSRIPLQRIAEPDDISPLVTFLCLPAASYITGQIICVDGGWIINCFYPLND
uniref:Tropinone reductase homolog At5g06060-like n=1 Tax=Nelumbo nucifera TaxID=4432 RepID=A0A822YA91_NELNU|nr:TPA_asm: hypothetical protein HUJ06_009855 [Nelumbo nucifera]